MKSFLVSFCSFLKRRHQTNQKTSSLEQPHKPTIQELEDFFLNK